MFDFGFWELTVIMVVALLVVGPERLPALAAQVGRWVAKARRVIASVRADIESEIKAAELKEILQKQQDEIGELKEMIKDTQKEIESDFNQQSDRNLIKAVEEQIESSKQQELTLSSEPEKHEAD